MDLLRCFDEFLGKVLKIGIVLVAVTVICAMTLQICSRYFLPLPIYGMDEFTGHTAVWLYMLGAAYGASINDHIRADLLEVFKVSPKVMYTASVFASCVSIVISMFLVVWSRQYVLWSIAKSEKTPSLHIPTVYFQTAILVGAVLLCLYFSKELIGKLRNRDAFIRAVSDEG